MLNFILPKFILKVEKWKWNSEYRVYVSNLGHFKNEHKQLLPIKINNKGYCLIKTEAGLKSAHRLVMLTWKPIPNAEELTVDHLDHNKRNNAVDNLEWVTAEENWERANKDFIYIAEPKQNTQKIESRAIIKAGQQKFTSFEEAAIWLIKNQNMPETTEINNIITKIISAINNSNKYCGRLWKLI